jgi:peptidoglycan/xylan/chitin deacetylase (PgdA/CDA1 family)
VSPPSVSVTFDNLGEVTALARGEWPPGEPLGRHHSVTRALPRILEALAGSGTCATFFVEGLNAELYPGALREIAAAGHEVALHGWRHERWADLDPAEEEALLRRGTRALRDLGLAPVGFRPPGGELTAATPGLLRELGYTYCSPAEGDAADIAVLPFRWELVDALYYLPHFRALREERLGTGDVQLPQRLEEAIAGALRGDDPVVLVFHPFLTEDAERLAVLTEALRRAGRSVPLRELAG